MSFYPYASASELNTKYVSDRFTNFGILSG